MMKSSLNVLKFSRAFSLVELLVVIAIISMMASLLFPSIESGIQKAQGVKCLSNLRQIGGAVQQYVADPENGHQFPPIYNVSSSNASSQSGVNSNAPSGVLLPLQCLGTYGVTMGLLTCPMDKTPDTNYGSYLWSPVLQSEHPEDVHVYTRGGVFTISKLSTMTVCTDKGMPHLGKLNVLRADGHVETKP
jgi:prepilin-type N-terminal cleavage/methylation domain-containing protein/prepilin-type processing-associated H-X9-DG protein